MKKILVILILLSWINLVIATPPATTTTTPTTTTKKAKVYKTTKKKRRHRKKTAVVKHRMPMANKTVSAPRTQVASDIPTDTLDMDSIANQPGFYSYSALALDADTGKILVSKNPHTKMPIASISKLMTAMVLLDSGADLNQYVTISAADVDTLRKTPSHLSIGMQLKRKDLLLLALMSSENRAAFALGRTAYPGGIKVFISKMNQKAKALGMNNTQFYDPTGLTKQNQSTAEDLSKMVQAAFSYDLIRQDTTTKGADVALSSNYIHHYINSDALVRAGKFQIELSKTGFINEAGHCLVLYSIVGKEPIVMVFLNSAGKSGRLLDALAVKNYIQRTS